MIKRIKRNLKILCVAVASFFLFYIATNYFYMVSPLNLGLLKVWADGGGDDDHGGGDDDHGGGDDDHGGGDDDHGGGDDDHGGGDDDHGGGDDDHGGGDDDHGGGCNSGQGNITLDASKASISGGGTVWSNNQLDHGQSAPKSTHVSLKGDPTTIINQPGTDGMLVETTQEFSDSKNTYTELDQTGGLAPLSYFDQSDQLFDFDRYNAAANSTGNSLTWSNFETAVQNSTQLYGIVSVTVDFNNGNNDITLDAGSINVKGTLVVNVINNPNNKKLKVEIPININPVTSPSNGTVDLTSTDFDNWTSASANRTSTSAPSPWLSGYESAWDDVADYSSGAKDPRGVSISGYPTFGQNEDMPALMYEGGTVDIHHRANISGVVYTPGFVEIEQKQKIGEVQYINGAVVAGNGIYLESNSCSGGIGVIYDPQALDYLGVTPSISALKRLSWKRL